jgi:hypothetical protein
MRQPRKKTRRWRQILKTARNICSSVFHILLERVMSELAVRYAKSNAELRLNPKTPLIAALENSLSAGKSLVEAINALRAKPALDGEIGAALERLQKNRWIIVDPVGNKVQLTRLTSQLQEQTLDLSKSADQKIQAGSATLSVSATAKLALVSSVLDANAAEAIALPVAAGDILHKLRFGGNLGVKGSAELDALAVSTEAALDSGISWYFERHQDDTVVGSLVDAALELSAGIRPWDLAEVQRVLEQPPGPDWHMDGLRAIDINVERSVAFAAEVSLKRSFLRALAAPEVSVVMGAEVSFGFSARRSGQFEIRLTRDDQGAVVLAMQRSNAQARTSDFGLSIGIGLKGADKLAGAWLEKLLPQLHPELKANLERWSKPGDVFKAELQKNLAQFGPLAQLVFAEISPEEASADLVNKLSERLLDRWVALLDARVNSVSESAQAIVERLFELDERIAVPAIAERARTVQSLLVDAIETWQAQVTEQASNYATSLKDMAKAELSALLKPIQDAGENLTAWINDANRKANAFLTPLRNILKRYESLRKSLIGKVQELTKRKLMLEIAAQSSVEKGESHELILSFARDANPEATQLFQRIVLGQGEIELTELPAGVTVERGSFATFVKRARSFSVSLDLFGLQFSDARVLASEVDLQLDGNGVLRLFNLSASQVASSSNPWSQQAARFRADFDLVAPEPDVLRGALSLSFELQGEHLKPERVAEFLGDFVQAQLLESGQKARALKAIAQLKNRQVLVTASLNGFEKASVRSQEGQVQQEALEACRRFVGQRDGDAKTLLEAFDNNKLLVWFARMRDVEFIKNKIGNEIRQALNALEVKALQREEDGWFNAMWKLRSVVYAIPDTVACLERINTLAKTLEGEVLTETQASTQRDALDKIGEELQKAITPAASVKGAIARLVEDDLPNFTVALLSVLANHGLTVKLAMFRYQLKKDVRVLGDEILY